MEDKERVVYFNGKLVPESQAKVSIFCEGQMYGTTIFEMLRSFDKKHFKVDEHLDRLYAGLKYLHIDIPLSKDAMKKVIDEVTEANEPMMYSDDEHRIMINVDRGALGIYQGKIKGLESGPNVIIADFPLRYTTNAMAHLYEIGVNACIPSQRAIPARYLDPKIKNRSRLHYMRANIEVSQMKEEDGIANWALLLDDDGFITEGTGDNFAILKDGVIMTPEGRNCLRGISMHYIEQLVYEAYKGDIYFTECNIEPYDVVTADEAFYTATPFCIMPCVRFNGQNIGDGKPGKITQGLLEQWSKNVGVDIKKQIQDWAKEETGEVVGMTPYGFREKR